MNLCRIFPRPLLLPAFALVVSLSAQTAGDDAAQRQLRDDRERFSREVERQAIEAKIRDDQARASADEQRTREELERLRVQQSGQAAETSRIKQRLSELPVPAQTTSIRSNAAPVSVTSAIIVPDFSVTFLADGNCVIYVKDHAPEVKSPAETEKALRLMLSARKSTAASPGPPSR